MPVRTPGPTTRIGAFAQRSAKPSYSRTSAGTVEDRQTPPTCSRSMKRPISAPSSSPVRCASVATRQCSSSSASRYNPNTVWVLPASTARSNRRRALGVVVGGERFADPLGERLRRQMRSVALAAQLLDGDVRRGEDLRPRQHPRRAVLVPDPHVLHGHAEERVVLARHELEVVLVAEIGRVLRQDAVTEEAEDGGVLLLDPELELRLVLVQLVEVRHRGLFYPGEKCLHRALFGHLEIGIELGERLENEP